MSPQSPCVHRTSHVSELQGRRCVGRLPHAGFYGPAPAEGVPDTHENTVAGPLLGLTERNDRDRDGGCTKTALLDVAADIALGQQPPHMGLVDRVGRTRDKEDAERLTFEVPQVGSSFRLKREVGHDRDAILSWPPSEDDRPSLGLRRTVMTGSSRLPARAA